MDKKLAISLLLKQKEEIETLRSSTYSDAKFKKWKRDTVVALKNIFYNDESYINDFENISFNILWVMDEHPEEDYAHFQHGIDIAKSIIQSFIDEIETYCSDEGTGKKLSEYFVSPHRIEELLQIKSADFDLSKLIRLCDEINIAFQHASYYSCALITRAILDHIPPVFGYKSFAEVTNNFPFSKSIKKNLEHLDTSLRNIADSHLHTPISPKEILPTKQQINFSNDLDVLLGEVIRILKQVVIILRFENLKETIAKE